MTEHIRINWYRCKVDRALMSALMKRSDARGFLQAGGHLLVYAITGAIAWLAWRHLDTANWPWGLPLLLAALFVHGTVGGFIGGIACHELSHKTPFATQVWNTVFLKIYAFLGWFDPVGYRASHTRHHQVTVHQDHDGEIVQPLGLDMHGFLFAVKTLTFSPAYIWKQVRFMFAAAFGDLSHDGFFKSAWLRRVVPETDARSHRELIRWARVVVLGHLALAVLFILTGQWFLIIVVNLGAFYCGWLVTLCGLPQHAGLASDVNDFRLNCRTFTCGPVPAFLYWNMHYHVEHHMFPAVPFYNLPRLRAAIAHDLPPATHGLWATWRDVQAILRRQRAEPGYVYLPPLPHRDGDLAADTTLLAEASEAAQS